MTPQHRRTWDRYDSPDADDGCISMTEAMQRVARAEKHGLDFNPAMTAPRK